jgi:hypothetical protein
MQSGVEFKSFGYFFFAGQGWVPSNFKNFFAECWFVALHPAFGPRFIVVLLFEKYAQGGFCSIFGR